MIYYVYLITNQRNTVLYVGATNDRESRIFDHKGKRNHGFTSKYNCEKLVYFEEFEDIVEAIHRERQLKRYHRKCKNELIEKSNPCWKDLSAGGYDPNEFEIYWRTAYEKVNLKGKR